MRRLGALLFGTLLTCVPVSVEAAICFSGPGEEVTLLEVIGSTGHYFSLVGEHFPAPDNPNQAPQGLTGSAHLRPDGTAHFTYTAVGPAPSLNAGLIYSVSGTLEPPNFNSGTGVEILVIDTTSVGGQPVTFVPAPCPQSPQ